MVCGQELPICVPNLKVIASSVKLGHVPQATPNFVPICGPGARTAHGLCKKGKGAYSSS